MLFYERVEGIDVVVPPSRSSTPAIWATEEMAAVPTPRNGGGAGSPAAVPLPAMPRQVRSEVMTQNLQFVFNGNLFSREYFDFIRQLVDSTLRGIARKAPRRSRAGPSGGGGASRGPGSGRLSCGDGPGPSGDSPAPAPGRRRSPEDEDEHAVLGIRIATEFLCHVYLRAHHSLRAGGLALRGGRASGPVRGGVPVVP
jgi:ubiquitin carboxyl-terminal hydrolase 9/24